MDEKTRNTQYFVPALVGFLVGLIGASQFLPNLAALGSGGLEEFDAVDSARFAFLFLFAPYGNALVLVSLWYIDPKRDLPSARAVTRAAAVLAAFEMACWIAMGSGGSYGSIGLVNYVLGAFVAALGIVIGHTLLLRWRRELIADS